MCVRDTEKLHIQNANKLVRLTKTHVWFHVTFCVFLLFVCFPAFVAFTLFPPCLFLFVCFVLYSLVASLVPFHSGLGLVFNSIKKLFSERLFLDVGHISFCDLYMSKCKTSPCDSRIRQHKRRAHTALETTDWWEWRRRLSPLSRHPDTFVIGPGSLPLSSCLSLCTFPHRCLAHVSAPSPRGSAHSAGSTGPANRWWHDRVCLSWRSRLRQTFSPERAQFETCVRVVRDFRFFSFFFNRSVRGQKGRK